MKNTKLAGLSKQERKIISHFSAIEQETIDLNDLIKVHPCEPDVANQILSRLYKKGWLQRLKRGVYSLVPISSSSSQPVVENAWTLAMDLFNPSFISGWSAAEHWNLTEQIFNKIAVVTTVPQKKTIQLIGNINFRTRTVDEERFFGFKKIWLGSKSVNVADPNRLIIDILDLPRFGGGARHTIDIFREYWRSEVKDADLLLKYAIKYKKGSVFKRLGFLSQHLEAPVSKDWLQTCQKNITSGITYLDPDGPESGKIISQWNLQINVPL